MHAGPNPHHRRCTSSARSSTRRTDGPSMPPYCRRRHRRLAGLDDEQVRRYSSAHLMWGERMKVGNTNSHTASTKCQYMAYTCTVTCRSSENLPSQALICTTMLITRPTNTWNVCRPTVV